MSTAVEDLLVERIKALAVDQQREVLGFIESILKQTGEPESIWDEIDEITSRVPAEMWDEVPSDGSVNVDHYLYGSPKKP